MRPPPREEGRIITYAGTDGAGAIKNILYSDRYSKFRIITKIEWFVASEDIPSFEFRRRRLE